MAVLMVVAFHAGLPISGGFSGVDAFFVISGFVITAMLSRELTSSGRIRLKTFYARRIRRLLPAMALVTVTTLAVSLALHFPIGDQTTTASTAAAAALFLANVSIYRTTGDYFGAPAEANPLLHTWSLGVEEQFYLVFPAGLFAIWLFARRRGSNARVLALAFSVALLLASFALSYATSTESLTLPGIQSAPAFAFYLLPARAWEFAAGVGVALALPWLMRLPSAVAPWLGAAGAALLAFGALSITGESPFPGTAALLPVTGTALLIVAGVRVQSGVSRVLGSGPLVRIGDMSYSLYLWHWPAIVVARGFWPGSATAVLAAAALAMVPAWASFRFVEEPIRRGRMSGRRVALLTVTCIGFPFTAALAVHTGASAGWGREDVLALERSRGATPITEADGCLADTAVERELLGRCRWEGSEDKGWIMLAGDSHANSLSTGVVRAARSLGYGVRGVVGSSCSFSDVARFNTDFVANCGDLTEWLTDAAEQSNDRAALVVVTHSSAARVRELERLGHERPLETWTAALAGRFTRLNRAGVPVVLVMDAPRMGASGTPCRFGTIIAPDCSVSKVSTDREQGAAKRAEMQLAQSLPNVSTVDLTSAFCDARRCDAARDGQLLYRDNQHLNARGSASVAPMLRRSFDRAIGASKARRTSRTGVRPVGARSGG